MKTSILIVSHLPDLAYLEFNLRSIAKFATGFHEVVVLVPQDEYDAFKKVTDMYISDEYCIVLVYYYRSSTRTQWHLAHQLQKCHADTCCPDADFVLHTDSDCMFTESVTPEDYFVGGKPVMLYAHYDRLAEKTPWRPVVSAVLKKQVDHEFMRRHPQVNPIGVYPALREHIEQLHGLDFDKFVMSRRPSFPWGFTEHNIIGAFAYNDIRFRDQYHWHDAAHGVPKEKLIQFWSGSDIHKPQDISHGGRYTPAKFAERILS